MAPGRHIGNQLFAAGNRRVCPLTAGRRRKYPDLMAAHLRLAGAPSNGDAQHAEQSSIRIILADDHALMRRSLRLLLESEEDLQVIAEADDLALVATHVHGHKPNVLVLDLSMPGGSSIEALSQLRERVPETQVVVLTMDENPVFAQRALTAGALGFVLKELADEELPSAVRAAARGEEYISPHIMARLQGLQRSLTDDKLTPREIEVLRLIALGHTSVEVARKLHLSPRTIETHRTRIHRKLGLATRAELVRYALGRGLLKT
jgi:two-component system response regulator NreC